MGVGVGTGARIDDDGVLGMDTEVAYLLSTAWMETYSRLFLTTTGITVKDKEDDNKTGYSWADNIEMKDIREANRVRNVREDIEVAVG